MLRVRRPEGKSLVGLGKLGAEEVVLAKPQTFMNASGLAVRDLVGRFDTDPEKMIVVTDDAARVASASMEVSIPGASTPPT